MEFYEAVRKRRTVREFLDKEVDFEAIKRILEAGNQAPVWNHNRNWSYIILRTEEEKEYAFESKRNPFSTIWCVIENIFLAATAEGLG